MSFKFSEQLKQVYFPQQFDKQSLLSKRQICMAFSWTHNFSPEATYKARARVFEGCYVSSKNPSWVPVPDLDNLSSGKEHKRKAFP